MAATFEYRARDRSGRTVQGTMEAESPDAVVRRLRQDGLFVTTVRRAARQGGEGRSLTLWRRAPKPGDMAMLCRQLAMMSRAGLTLVDSLRILAQQTTGSMHQALEAVRRDIAAGSSLGRAFGRHPEVFSPLMVQLVEVGELTGSLDEVLEQLGLYFQREHELRSKVRESLAYPMVVALVAVQVAQAAGGGVVGPHFKQGFHLGLGGTMADEVSRGPAAHRQREGIQQDRLSGPRLAGQHVEAFGKGDMGLLD